MGDNSAEIAVVVRYTQYERVGPSECVSLMRAFQDPLDADAEAARLNGARRDDKVEYFVKMLKVDR